MGFGDIFPFNYNKKTKKIHVNRNIKRGLRSLILPADPKLEFRYCKGTKEQNK
jgi:hypothetical protein